jgi:hypothetical protein
MFSLRGFSILFLNNQSSLLGKPKSMLDTIGSHEGQYALVPPQAFADQMNSHWTQKLGLCSSPALRTLWRIMGETYQSAIVETAQGAQSPWRIVQPPTGSGKTQGTCVYAAMQADLNRDTEGLRKPVGILIVTRRIEQAIELETAINDMAGRVVAVAHHHKQRASEEQLQSSDVLIITHQAYVNASQSLHGHRSGAWKHLLSWRGGQRLLTIIDEALANAIDENKVTTANLSLVLGYIPVELYSAYAEEVAVLRQLHEVLMSFVGTSDIEEDDTACMVWPDAGAPRSVDMSPLREAMRQLPYDRIVLSEDNPAERTKIAQRVDAVLQDAEAVLDQFAYYALQGKEHSINSSSMLIPWGIPGPVVLDATARANFLWDLFEERHTLVVSPSHARDYSNVTLHVARTSGGLGKQSMTKHIGARWPRVLEALEAKLGPDRSVFVCMHKATEHVALTYKTNFKRFAVNHWGAIDGRNDWSDFDTAVILGLPYRGSIWANNTFFALQGAQDDAWLKSPQWKQHHNVRRLMEQRQLSVSIIQAINRVRCRRAIDAEGRSPTADIFVVLPKDKYGDGILDDIRADMPGLNVVDWDLELDGPKVHKARKGSSHEALIRLMGNRLPGQTPLSLIKRA